MLRRSMVGSIVLGPELRPNITFGLTGNETPGSRTKISVNAKGYCVNYTASYLIESRFA